MLLKAQGSVARRGRGESTCGASRKEALYQHACHEVQSGYNILSLKELQPHPTVGLMSQQRLKSISVR